MVGGQHLPANRRRAQWRALSRRARRGKSTKAFLDGKFYIILLCKQRAEINDIATGFHKKMCYNRML